MQTQFLSFLVDDRVNRYRRLAGLAVADDQLALAAPDRDHRVNRLDAGLERRVHVLALDDARRDALDLARLVGGDRPLVVNRLADRVNHAPDQRVTDRHRGDAAGRTDRLSLLDVGVIAHDDDADTVLGEVQRQAEHATFKLDQLGRHHLAETVDGCDAVTNLDNRADIGNRQFLPKVLNFAANDVADFRRSDDHRTPPAAYRRATSRSRNLRNWLVTLPSIN
jgi:hypothetical protein